MKNYLSFLLLGTVLLTGCGAPSDKPVDTEPEAWTKLDDRAKLAKLKTMSLGVQQKIEAINKLNVPEAEKKAAIAEVQAGGGAPTAGAPSNPGTSDPGG